MSRTIATLATAVIATISFAIPAQADDQAYLDYLRTNNINVYAWTKDAQLYFGYAACKDIQGGADPAQVADRLNHDWVDGNVVVSTAQRELCPDTLGNPADPH